MGIEMWYLASQYPSEAAAGREFFPIQEWMKGFTADISLFRIMIKGVWHVMFIGDGVGDDPRIEKVRAQFKHPNFVEVEHRFLETMAVRRGKRIADSGGRWTETHEPVAFEKVPEAIGSQMTFFNVAPEPELEIPPYELPEYQRRLKGKPFIIAYQQYSRDSYTYKFQQMMRGGGAEGELSVETGIGEAAFITDLVMRINAARLRRSRKYLFTSSALELHKSILLHRTQMGIAQRPLHVWIECPETQESPYGPMRALFFCNAYPFDEINALYKDHSNYENALSTYSIHKDRWGLEVIDGEYRVVFDFTYDYAKKEWVFLPSHVCPTGKCVYPASKDVESFLEAHMTQFITPCEHCVAACKHYARWLDTALAMIDGEYTLSPDDPDFETTVQQWQEDVRKRVGKGKNRHVVNVQERREVEYTLVTYDVTKGRRRLTTDEQHAVEARKNWLVTTPEGQIIWQRRPIKTYARRYPTRKDGTQQSGAVRVKDYEKRVPMLRDPKHPVITKVVASKQGASHEK